jgi:hypothetical protein
MTEAYNALARMFTDKMYVFAFDLSHLGVNVQIITQYINDSRTISSWSYCTPGVFLLRSTQRALHLSEALRTVTGGARCLVIEVDPVNVGGWLPQEAWNWFSQHVAQHTPGEPSNALALGLINSPFNPRK